MLACVQLFATLWATVQAPLSKGFSRQEYWSGLPFPSPGDLPEPGIKPGSPAQQADSLPTKIPGMEKMSNAHDPPRNQAPCGLSIIKPPSYKPNKMAAGMEGSQAWPESFPGSRSSRSRQLPLTLTCCMTLNRSDYLSEPQFPHLEISPSQPEPFGVLVPQSGIDSGPQQ